MNGPAALCLGLLLLGAAGGGIDTAPPAEADAGASATYEQLADLAAGAGFPQRHQDDMVAIAMAESSGDLGAVGGPNDNGTYDYCYWQINSVHGYDADQLTSDATYCATAAKDVYDRQGLGAWTVYDTGAYEQYLGEARAAVQS